MNISKIISKTQQVISIIEELDHTFLNLKKTSNMSIKELENFYYSSNDIAKKVGVTTKEFIEQTNAWSNLGFSNYHDATEMAKLSSQFKLISPGMTLDDATSGLANITRAYHIPVDNVLDSIISKINIISNKFSLNNKDIISMLQNSAYAMANGNNTLAETIALETTAFKILNNPDNVGNGFKTMALRLNGINEETKEFDSSLNSIKNDLYELTGISIMENSDAYKSTYKILKEISEIWPSLNNNVQTETLKLLFGKSNSNIGSSVLNNFTTVEKAIKHMANSSGNATLAISESMNSLEYQLNQLSETSVGIVQNLFGRHDTKIFITVLTKLAESIDWITSKLGLLGTIGTSAFVFMQKDKSKK